MNKIAHIIIGIFIIYFILKIGRKINWNSKYEVGQVLDEYNGVKVYYNGGVSNLGERNLTKDGYNIGIKYQCVEFIKRYYYEHFNHKMPDSYGNAIDFYNKNINDGDLNIERDLIQYKNPSVKKPKEGDIIIFDKTIFNSYGHIAIISKVTGESIEIIQQNSGPFEKSRKRFTLKHENNLWTIQNERVLARLSIQ
jgi:surface antigen